MPDNSRNGDAHAHNGDQTARFGMFEVDLRAGELRKSGSRVKLQDQPFKVLQILLERPGAVVTREELQARIWPDESFGDFDHAVNIAIGKLRSALGDSAENPSLIETVPRRGYRFVGRLEGSVSPLPAEALTIRHPLPGASGLRRALKASLLVILSGVFLVLGVFLGVRTGKLQPMDFQRLTVERGTVYAARFAPDAHDVIYSASWNGAPTEIFSINPKAPGARRLGLQATLLAVSSLGEMAVLQPLDHRFWLTVRGTLSRVRPAEGSPRQIAEDVDWADWTPDGKMLAIVRDLGGTERLEFPLGHVLYETTGWISHIRISPKADAIAFLDHASAPDDRGVVSVVDLAGNRRVLSAGWETEEGLAWSVGGGEVWFSAARAGNDRRIYAVDLKGHQRLVFRALGGVTLQDIAPDGRVLLTRDDQRVGMMGLAHGATREQDLSWLDWSFPMALSSDAKTVLFDEQGEESGPTYIAALRAMDGSPPILLGEGEAGTLSPDGKWASTIIANTRLVLLPTGAGTARRIERADIEKYWPGVYWLPEGERIVFSGNQPGHAIRCFVQSVNGGKPHPLTPEGVAFCQPSPDGKWMASSNVAHGGAWLYPVSGGEPRPIPGLRPDEAFAWTADPHFVYAYQGRRIPVKVYRLNILTGQRQLFQEISPADVAGLGSISHLLFSSDGQAHVYSYTRLLSDLYMVTGVK